MIDGKIVPYADTYNHLGNTISIKSDKCILDTAVNDFYMRTNCLVFDFSFTERSTLSCIRVFRANYNCAIDINKSYVI